MLGAYAQRPAHLVRCLLLSPFVSAEIPHPLLCLWIADRLNLLLRSHLLPGSAKDEGETEGLETGRYQQDRVDPGLRSRGRMGSSSPTPARRPLVSTHSSGLKVVVT